jgi:hypothetical protein
VVSLTQGRAGALLHLGQLASLGVQMGKRGGFAGFLSLGGADFPKEIHG